MVKIVKKVVLSGLVLAVVPLSAVAVPGDGDKSVPQVVPAVEPAASEDANSASPRFRMADQAVGRDDRSGLEPQKTKEDFNWNKLTAGSGASGEDPVIGNRLKHSFYDFRDGFDLPKYVAGPKSAIK